MTFIKELIKFFIPYGIINYRKKRNQLSQSKQRIQKKNEIRDYFLSLTNITDPEILEIIKYFQNHKFSIFPYEFVKKYHAAGIEVFYDDAINAQYVLHKNKRLYFPEKWETDTICAYYNGLCIEQDKESPHHYETDIFSVQDGDIIADIGTAEGIWALNYAEKAKRIYLFECTPEWIEALQKTFEPWKEKVVIVNKFVSNIDDKKNVTLDNFFKDKQIDFIKADIEGMEIKLLEGSKNILANNGKLKLLLCAYHKKDDEFAIKKILEKNNFEIECSQKYMLFIHDKSLEKPYIRRGLIRAIKNRSVGEK